MAKPNYSYAKRQRELAKQGAYLSPKIELASDAAE